MQWPKGAIIDATKVMHTIGRGVSVPGWETHNGVRRYFQPRWIIQLRRGA
jgi:hypothetical protein